MMIIKTDDGHTFYILEDGQVTDNPDPDYQDMSWNSLEDFIQSQDLPLSLDISHLETRHNEMFQGTLDALDKLVDVFK